MQLYLSETVTYGYKRKEFFGDLRILTFVCAAERLLKNCREYFSIFCVFHLLKKQRSNAYIFIKSFSYFRYLATGCSLTELHYDFRIGRSTASSIILDVCETVWIELVEKVIPQCSPER